ncbi:hypothetical protein DAI22_10g157900 [Oryza sativa Japonica Group]|nr:hypothetical protein DAI22_10g157900 [Oryza sativa Japonica Group]
MVREFEWKAVVGDKKKKIAGSTCKFPSSSIIYPLFTLSLSLQPHILSACLPSPTSHRRSLSWRSPSPLHPPLRVPPPMSGGARPPLLTAVADSPAFHPDHRLTSLLAARLAALWSPVVSPHSGASTLLELILSRPCLCTDDSIFNRTHAGSAWRRSGTAHPSHARHDQRATSGRVRRWCQ